MNNTTLTLKQKAFAEIYIECGNATEAAKRAGYSEKSAKQIGMQNLRKPEISEYIDQCISSLRSERIADIHEILVFLTAVMRGEQKDQFGLDAALSDRLKAADSLMKRYDAGKSVPGGPEYEDDPLSKALRELENECTIYRQ